MEEFDRDSEMMKMLPSRPLSLATILLGGDCTEFVFSNRLKRSNDGHGPDRGAAQGYRRDPERDGQLQFFSSPDNVDCGRVGRGCRGPARDQAFGLVF